MCSFGLDAFVFLGGSLGLEEGEDGVLVGAVDVGLLHDLEGDAEVDAAELLNLAVGARVLFGELVAGEANHHETAVAVFLVECLEAVELWGEAALAGGVDNEHGFALELTEINLFAVACNGFEVIDAFFNFHSINYLVINQIKSFTMQIYKMFLIYK